MSIVIHLKKDRLFYKYYGETVHIKVMSHNKNHSNYKLDKQFEYTDVFNSKEETQMGNKFMKEKY